MRWISRQLIDAGDPQRGAPSKEQRRAGGAAAAPHEGVAELGETQLGHMQPTAGRRGDRT